MQKTTCGVLFAVLSGCLVTAGARVPQAADELGGSIESQSVTSRELTFRDGETELAGTLFQPASSTACPGVLLLGGAERGPRTVFSKRMAQLLAHRGVAVLIYDSPGSGDSSGDALLQTRAARAREAVAGVQFLRRQVGIHPERVGVWGTSEGANIALLAAGASPDVAFAVAASGAFGISHQEVLHYRIETQGTRRGLSTEQIAKALLFGDVLFAMLAGPDAVSWPLIETKAARWPEEPFQQLGADVRRCRDELSPEQANELWASIQRSVAACQEAPWFGVAVPDPDKFMRFFAADASSALTYLRTGPFASGDRYASWREYSEVASVRCPILAVWGAQDSFVPPDRSAAALRACLGESNHEDVTIQIIPGASHVMTTGDLSAPFAADYPELVGSWLQERFAVRDR